MSHPPTDAAARLVADLREAIRQHRGAAVPTEQLRVVLARYTRELGEPREASDSDGRLARTIASHVIDSLNEVGFAESLAELVAAKVAEQVEWELAPYSGQACYTVPVEPAWSGWCFHGEHEKCRGDAVPLGPCHCPHHAGEPVEGMVVAPAQVSRREEPADHPIGGERPAAGSEHYDRDDPGAES